MDSEKLYNLDKRPKWKLADSFVYSHLKDVRKQMRDQMTEAESLLWNSLKSKKTGVKFRRQHMIDGFIPDFVALSCMLIIEVDGKIHNQQREHDIVRTLALNEKGFHVIRFTNEEILNDIESVLMRIIAEIRRADPSRPPQSGEEGSKYRIL
jgi:very-short-patch-repair endonuclease